MIYWPFNLMIYQHAGCSYLLLYRSIGLPDVLLAYTRRLDLLACFVSLSIALLDVMIY